MATLKEDDMESLSRARKTLRLTLPLALAAALIAADVEAGKRQKKNKKKPKEAAAATQEQAPQASGLSSPPKAFENARKHLLAYETDAAREALEEGGAEGDVWVATARAWIFEQENDLAAAAAESRRAAELDPRNPAPVIQLGESLAYAQKEGEAKDAYARAEARAKDLLAARAEDPEALYYLGLAQQRQRRFEESAATLEKARELRPGDALTLFQLGTTRFYQQRWQQAFDTLSEALERNSGIALAYYYRGLAAGKLDQKDVLYNDLDRFVRLAPNAPEAANARQILASFG